jgi:hypothetical protein
MSKLGNHNRELERALEMGRNNARIIPEAKKWCSHLVIEDTSAGMVHEMYRLPMNQNIHCPHTTNGTGGMNFEWIATDFILESCLSCEYHNEVSPNNFGRKIIAANEKRLLRIKEIDSEKQIKRETLFREIQSAEQMLRHEFTVSQKSILEIIYSLGDPTIDPSDQAKKILEASKIVPAFFNATATDFLSLYFEEEYGDILISALSHTLRDQKKNISEFLRARLRDTILNNIHINQASNLYSKISDDNALKSDGDLFVSIIENLSYEKQLGSTETEILNPAAIDLVLRFNVVSPDLFKKTINKQLQHKEINQRNNINGILQEMTSKAAEITISFLDRLIDSFEYPDEEYYYSADHSTCITIKGMFSAYPEVVLEALNKKYPQLTLGAKIEVFPIYWMILTDKSMTSNHPQHCSILSDRLISLLLEKDGDAKIKQKILDTLGRISSKSDINLHRYFEALLGYFIELVKQLKTFQWYFKELDLPAEKQSTLNPLRGKSFLDIHSLEMDLSRKIGDTEDLLKIIIDEADSKHASTILSMIVNLESSIDGELKARLIGLLRKSVKDLAEISIILPNLYSFLLDYKSRDVRDEGLKFLNHLIDKHSQIVTQSFIDLVKVFLDDTDNLIKARAIECLTSLCATFPENVGQPEVVKYLSFLSNTYKIIHKTAIREIRPLYHLFSSQQKKDTWRSLLAWEETYFNDKEDGEFSKDVLKVLLWMTKEDTPWHRYVVDHALLKHCNKGDYYSILDTLKQLSEIREEDPFFDRRWLVEVIKFLSKTQPDMYSSFDDRDDFIDQIYKLPLEIIRLELPAIISFTSERIDKAVFSDVLKMFGILSYFNLHEDLKNLATIFHQKVPTVTANQGIHDINNLILQLSAVEVAVGKGQVGTIIENLK